jgi:CheY-like chemotaxis protein
MAFILVEDDLPFLRTFARRVLETAGHEVVEAGDGSEALELYRGRPADLVLCDVWMPGMNGLDLLRALRRECPGVRFVAMSGGGIGGHDALPTSLEL